MDDLDKLITLARGARARIGAETGAAVMDDTGRSYAGTDVVLPSLRLTAVELAVASAIAAGARALTGVAIVGIQPELHHHQKAVLREAGAHGASLALADASGSVTRVDTL